MDDCPRLTNDWRDGVHGLDGPARFNLLDARGRHAANYSSSSSDRKAAASRSRDHCSRNAAIPTERYLPIISLNHLG